MPMQDTGGRAECLAIRTCVDTTAVVQVCPPQTSQCTLTASYEGAAVAGVCMHVHICASLLTHSAINNIASSSSYWPGWVATTSGLCLLLQVLPYS